MKTFKQYRLLKEQKQITVYNGTTRLDNEVKAMGSGVGTTIGSGIYVTSNKDDTEKGLAAIDYAGGKFTSGKPGVITEFLFTITDNMLWTDKRYYIEDIINFNENLKPWFKQRLQQWVDRGWYKDGMTGGSIVRYIQSPPKGHGTGADIGKAGFDAIITPDGDGGIYEASVTNTDLLEIISREHTVIGKD